MTVSVRFAPSPTGRLHIGNIRTAVLNWLFARRNGGSFMLRLDDTDLSRSTAAFANAIREDLTWLGLVWDREARQSDRLARYEEVAKALKHAGRLYACFETEDELERRRARQRTRGLPPIYDRAALKLTAAEVQQRLAAGEKPHWRFFLQNTEPSRGLAPQPTLVTWHDVVRGEQTVDIGSLSDPVLIRADGTPLYTFTSVIDDIDFAISHIIRGEDHVTNSAVQIQLFEALGAEPPKFAHHSLLIGADGHALSKRAGDLSIKGLRDDGLEPLAVLCHAALLGTSEAVAPYTSLDELAQRLDLSKVSRAPGRFDIAELRALNARLLHMLPHEAVAEHLAALGLQVSEELWEAVRGNIATLGEVRTWLEVVNGPLTPRIEDAKLCATAAGLLPPEPWNAETWGAWTAAVRDATGIKGRALFHPLRLALTAREAGPELRALLPLIGRSRAEARLNGRPA
ncbi:MAG: glutamate--tRNA ligase [Hyphomicrobium sp. SCN 65-11]|nr:MAG: glutamate--tRNA ligase [Hyphomicrobium sp. SCN 65-11]